jgi:hypothetical protein
MNLKHIARDLDEAIAKAQANPAEQVIFPGGAITLVADLPQHVVEQIARDIKQDSSTSR